jgi:hypothetical protein
MRPSQMPVTVGLKAKSDGPFQMSRGEPLTTTELMKQCYGFLVCLQGEKFKS